MAKLKKPGKKKKQARTTETVADRVVYSETVRCNIGDYEHRDLFMSFGTNVELGESPEEAYKRAGKIVRTNLQKREKKIRSLSQEHVDFDTKAKLI